MKAAIAQMNTRRRLLAVEAKVRMGIRRAHDDEHHCEQATQQMVAVAGSHETSMPN